jgi:SNF2 family DNA or RNA helicase
LFDELLEECESGGHKALVFSQFTGMLGLLRQVLDERGTPYCYLDGSSTDRVEQVERFQGGHGPGLFLISLKAGGYGLTLTAADTVIHYDPWWNPAVEAQATDRAHRIGQSRPVSSYKLIAAGTVEEKIVALQRKKRDVIEAALDDAAPLMQGLTLDDLREVMA